MTGKASICYRERSNSRPHRSRRLKIINHRPQASSRRALPRKRRKLRQGESPDVQDAHALAGSDENRLEVAIGRQVREFRNKMDVTVVELARSAGLSAGMLSKIENGIASPSLATLRALARALQVPVTSFFRKYEEERDATFVKAGQGLNIERRGTRAGHQYQLLGHALGKRIGIEPYLITLTEESDVFPVFQHAGMEFLYMIDGAVDYRHGDKTYPMEPGDSLFFDSDAPHGPENLKKLPARFLSIIVYLRSEGQ